MLFSLQQTRKSPSLPYGPTGGKKKNPILFLDRSARLLLGQGGKSKIWLDDLEFGEERLGLVVLHAGVHDNIIAYCTILSLKTAEREKRMKKKKFKTHQAAS